MSGKRIFEDMKKRAFKSSLWGCLIAVFALTCTNRIAHQSSAIQSPPVQLVLSDSALLPACGASGELVRHLAYTLCYDERYEQARWVAYRLTRAHLENTVVERADNFRPDPEVKSGSATPEDYKKSGYDRSHLNPSADNRWSKQAMEECFYMSNMTAMKSALNRGRWSRLEDRARRWAIEDNEVFVVTGGVLKDGLPKIGQHGVSVPHTFYKVIFDCSLPDLKMIAFMLPNEGSKDSLSIFAVSVDSVEKVTGLDFFPDLPDSLENALERDTSAKEWFH